MKEILHIIKSNACKPIIENLIIIIPWLIINIRVKSK
jgi:hypothetical protein